MVNALSVTLAVLSLVATAFAGALAALDRRINWWLLGLLGVIELALVVQLVVGVVQLADTDRDVSGITFVSYLVGALVILPIGALWALAESSRWGAGVLAVACLVIPVMLLRLHEVWAG